jgi:hypothetical protein
MDRGVAATSAEILKRPPKVALPRRHSKNVHSNLSVPYDPFLSLTLIDTNRPA